MAVHLQDEQRLALFIDFENIAIGVRDAHYRKFDVNLVLERILEKGKLLVKKAYADWSRYSDYKRSFHEAAIELIEVPQKSLGGKNSADIRLVVDAMDMSFQKEHINCFVVASGDSDFSPLVSKLKENNKYVIGLGVKNSTSDLLIENCDEFIFYEDLVRGQQRPMPHMDNLPEKQQEVMGLLVDAAQALQRENKEVLWGSMIKETMKRKKPSFNETYYGFRTFSHLLEEAQRKGIVSLRRDQKSGSYIIEDLGTGRVDAVRIEPAAAAAVRAPEAPAAAASEGEAANGRAPRRRRSRTRRTRPAAAGAPATEGAEAYDEERDEAAAEPHDSEETAAEPPSPPAWAAAPPAPTWEPDRPPSATPADPASGEDTPRGAGAERPFSLFSWMRREPDKPRGDDD